MRTLITGGEGQLGEDLAPLFAREGDTDAPDIDRLDVTDRDAVIEYLRHNRPDVVIHAAAMTDVDGCEKNEDLAFRINAEGSRHIAEACLETGARLVMVSTDFVFRGDTDRPYREDDEPVPLSAYGRSKLAGERAVQGLLPGAAVARTAWLYGEWGRGNFVRSILTAAEAGRTLRVVNDQFGSPTFSADAAAAIFGLVRRRGAGIFHIVNRGEASRYEFARAALDLAGHKRTRIQPVSTAEYPLPAPRPARSTLAETRLEALGVPPLRPWREALADFIGRIATPA
ncbi:MAG: dTDP-4-dehydrorhamnose reductase [Candidatus Eisenbacteria bacterium]|nr:dTDP-4-dehydrorhamnose reductase [Candidatus Eisenbacteria bacterium]